MVDPRHGRFQQRAGGDPAECPRQGLEVVTDGGHRAIIRGVVASVLRPQPPGSAPDPVDAQHDIQNRAKHRREPHEGDPSPGRGDLPLVQQDMDRDAYRQNQTNGQCHVRACVQQIPPDVIHGGTSSGGARRSHWPWTSCLPLGRAEPGVGGTAPDRGVNQNPGYRTRGIEFVRSY
jgi:hypothetical protein